MSELAVAVEALTKRYGDLVAVDDISFNIDQGETFVLLGPNGAGKSVTIEILEGFRHRTSGEVRVLGMDPAKADREFKSRVGIVLQQAGDLGRLSVRQTLTHFASLYPNPRSVDEVIYAVDLAQKADIAIRKLSGGQQHRVDVALGMIGNPELLFLDEPTTGFDPEVRRQFWQVIEGLKAEGTTIMLTTHYLDEAEALGDRAGVIIAGELVAIDQVHSIGGAEMRVPVVRWLEGGVERSERTSEPAQFVASLAERLGHEPERLNVRTPTLEDVYLAMLDGRSSR
ncbi:MAG: ABC transporter ATP-binding protein [Actinomycetota bacterium]|nr:ABC transporter ATP-binding protein [Actinomycetota bacterium]